MHANHARKARSHHSLHLNGNRSRRSRSAAKAKKRTIPGRPESQAMSNLDLHPENNDIFLHYSRLPESLRPFQTSAGAENGNLLRCIASGEVSCDASHVRRGGGRGATALTARTPRRGVPTSWSRQARPSLRGKSICRGDTGQAPFRNSRNVIAQNQT